MKSKLHNRLSILNYISSTDNYKVMFICTIVLSLYGSIGLAVSTRNPLDTVLIPFQFTIFNMFMFAILFLNTLNTCIIFNKEFTFYTLRLKSKRRYINELLTNVFLMHLYHLILFFMLYFIVIFIIRQGTISIHDYQNYSVSNLAYVVFYLLRYVILSLLLNLFTTLMYIYFKKTTTLFNFIFIACFMLVKTSIEIKNQFNIYVWSYFSNVVYESFSLELSYSAIYIFSLLFILFAFYFYTINSKKWSIL